MPIDMEQEKEDMDDMEDMNEMAGKQALEDPQLKDYSWIKYLPKVALEELMGLLKKAKPAIDSPKVARKVQEKLAGTSSPAQYRKAMDENIRFIVNQ